MQLPGPIEAMMQPDFYPHHCANVELLQTMTAWLLFAGELVYKVKKPVQLNFIDGATPARRYRLCRDEVSLNRRLAPEVYLGVAGIAEQGGAYLLVPDPAASQRNMRDFAVVMHRLPRERILDRMLVSGTVSLADMEELAAKLAAFHANSSIAKSKVWGSVRAIARLIENNLAEAKELAADSVTQNGVATAGEYLRSYIMTHQRLLENRARKGWVRNGHGDLRCDSICFLPESLVIIDCVEYSEALRYVDVASEVAALAVDLEMAGRQELSDGLIAGYIRASKDIKLPELLHFYKCYRALMRGKLEALVSLQAELPLERRMLARNSASRAFAMARRLATAAEQ